MWKDMNLSVNGESQVPPGFRFHPTEEELLHYNLMKKIASQKIDLDVIPVVDLNKLEPWDIQEKCRMGLTCENEWYVFSQRDKKYPTGSRTNRATSAGFWKATGRDKVIYSNNRIIIGMRKTLVFYKGRAPHGQKSDWMMHEYRLDDSSHDVAALHPASGELSGVSEDGWVVCRVFKKKMHEKALASSPHQIPIHSNNNNNGGVLDQMLTYNPQNQTKNSNYINIAAANDDKTMQLDATQFLHLPALENQPTNTDQEFISSLSQDHCIFTTAGAFPSSLEDMFTETSTTASYYYINNFLHVPFDDNDGWI